MKQPEDSRLKNLLGLIRADMKPALGVTEPGAIAFAVAKARSYTRGAVDGVTLALNSGLYKNAFTCGIPNSREVGNHFAAALGAVGADPKAGLESLAGISEEHNRQARELVEAGRVRVELHGISPDIFIRAEVRTGLDLCRVTIEGEHTRIVSIELNGGQIFQLEAGGQPSSSATGNGETGPAESSGKRAPIHDYSLAEMLLAVSNFDSRELSFLGEAYRVNLELFQAGLDSPDTTFLKALYRANGKRIFPAQEPAGQAGTESAGTESAGSAPDKTEAESASGGPGPELACAQLLCTGAIEARVLGLDKPAMSITGSGAHGIICTLPLLAWCKIRDLPEDKLLRATALSYLLTMYIKEYSGRLSAFCGCAIAAGTGMACALTWLRGGDYGQIAAVINNMASSITGMICDGGNQGCAMKGIIAVDAAFRSVELALAGVSVAAEHGINGPTPELTMKHMGRLAAPGMVHTEKTILDILGEKQGAAS